MNNDEIQKLFSQIKNADSSQKTHLASELKKSLSEQELEYLNAILSDKKLARQLLKSDEAAAVMNLFGGDDGGHK